MGCVFYFLIGENALIFFFCLTIYTMSATRNLSIRFVCLERKEKKKSPAAVLRRFCPQATGGASLSVLLFSPSEEGESES